MFSKLSAVFALVLGLCTALVVPAHGQRFYPDDPLLNEPPPLPVPDAGQRDLNILMDLGVNTFSRPGQRHPEDGVIPALGVNTLGEVMEGPWYNMRHYRKRMTPAELRMGPDQDDPPSDQGVWEVLTTRRTGVRPGILIRDADGQIYLLRFDQQRRPETTTGADIVTNRLMWALGYWTTDDYLVYFERDQMRVSEVGEDVSPMGNLRPILEEDVDRFLRDVPYDPARGYRALAHRAPNTKLLGPIQLHGTRKDDPNDIYPHEHRRDLRGLQVIYAWLNHAVVSPFSLLDVVATAEDGTPYIKHLHIDFVEALGSAYDERKPAWHGWERMFGWKSSGRNLARFGVVTPDWAKAKYPNLRGVGKFEYNVFDPERWMTAYPIVPFENMLPDDAFWAARQIMHFTDEEIVEIVKVGQYSDPDAAAWIAETLVERRNKIGAVYFRKVLPLDRFRVEGDRLAFDDLAIEHDMIASRTYSMQWFSFDNASGDRTLIGAPEENAFEIRTPPARQVGQYYLGVEVSAADSPHKVDVYLRRGPDGFDVVGVEHQWEGKVVAAPRRIEEDDRIQSRYPDLTERQKELFVPYTTQYVELSGEQFTPQEYYDSLRLSEKTTFEAVTHALSRSELTDEDGNSMGTALDLIERLERISGTFAGGASDEQFRLYIRLKPDAREKLSKAQEFFRDKDNTVYHVGYPISYRQKGKPPTIQVSMDEEGIQADMDVDYRSSKAPQALWNGHLTAANSDVRAGKNYETHGGRWSGLVNWWQDFFGVLEGPELELPDVFVPQVKNPTPLPDDRPRGQPVPVIEDAAQEFLTDWLVRDEVDEAIEFISINAKACVNLDDDSELEDISTERAVRALKEGMSELVDTLGRHGNLTEAIAAVEPWRKVFVSKDHPFRREFSVFKVPDAVADAFQCENRLADELQRTIENAPATYGKGSMGTAFKFNIGDDAGGVLVLVWAKEGAGWKIQSWEFVTQ